MKNIFVTLLCLGLADTVNAAQTCGLIPVDFGEGVFQSPYDNNDLGVIVGGRLIGVPPDGPRDALVWEGSEITVLPGLGGEDEWAYGINNGGQIAGYAEDAHQVAHAVVWDAGVVTKLRRLHAAPAGFIGKTGVALGLNDSGQIVGWSRAADGFTHAVLWQNGKIKDLNTVLGSVTSTANAINNKGQAVGWAQYDADRVEAFLYEAGVVQFLKPVSGTGANAFDINDRGQVVGVSETVAGAIIDHAVLWENGSVRDLGTLNGRSSVAMGINIHGQIVGVSDIATGERRAFSWMNGVMTRLGTLPRNDQGSRSDASVAQKINAKGQVVGYSVFESAEEYSPTRGWWWKRKC